MTYRPCDSFISLIVRAADDALSTEEARRLEVHVAGCAGCRDALADQRAVHLQLASFGEDLASAGFGAAVMDAVRADSPWTEWFNWRAWTWRLVPVAGVLLVVAVVVARGSLTSSASSSGQTETTAALDLSRLGSASGQAPVASALFSSSVSDESLLALVLTAKADDPLSAHLNLDKSKKDK